MGIRGDFSPDGETDFFHGGKKHSRCNVFLTGISRGA